MTVFAFARRSQQRAPGSHLAAGLLVAHFFPVQIHAQQTGMASMIPLPPLQWLNISGLLTGPSPPPLKDATIAYDEASRSLVIFGGESEGGFVQSQTYLLNLDTLAWSTPSPPSTLRSTPSPRSAALGGNDFAASNRHGFVIYGGKGANEQALSDVWEYDYNNQFWSNVVVSPGGPSPRWGASGGIDGRIPAIQDPIVPGPNNTFYLAGGFDGSTLHSLSDIWMLELSGTLSSNMPNTATGSWINISFGNFPSTLGQASTMLHQQLVVVDGCSNPSASNSSCPDPVSQIIDTGQKTQISPTFCPAPRMGAVLVPNVNAFSSSFSSQVFLLLGLFNTSQWQDDGGSLKGEVAVLNTNTGSWSRVLPSGDPGDNGVPSFPSPREGSAAFAHTSALVGHSRSLMADTIIFGGRDASGRYLSEAWLLRSYNGTITTSQQTWPGFGAGNLQTGIDANGAGVTLQYLSSCAFPLNSVGGSNSSHHGPSPGDSSGTFAFETSISHKVLAPLSIALLLPTVLLFRLVPSSFQRQESTTGSLPLMGISCLTALLSFIAGVTGIVTSFRSNDSSAAGPHTLRTSHGRTGLALFLGLYAVVPALLLVSYLYRPHAHHTADEKSEHLTTSRPRLDSDNISEVRSSSPGMARTSRPQSVNTPSRPSSPLSRSRPWLQAAHWFRDRKKSAPNDSDLETAAPVTSFKVVNRPARPRTRTHTTSTSGLVAASAESRQLAPNLSAPPTLRDMEWLHRRRALNAVGELDYAIARAKRAEAQEAAHIARPFTTPTTPTSLRPMMPCTTGIFLRLIFHSFLVASCILSLVALWSRAPRVFFAIFLLWTLSFYLSILVFAWLGKPQKSITAALISRLRTFTIANASQSGPCPEPKLGVNQVPFPTESRAPYIHQPPYTAALSHGDASLASRRSAEADDDDENEDEETRQRRMEDEMSRRDVSIVTVPKRRLIIVLAMIQLLLLIATQGRFLFENKNMLLR